MKLDTGSETLIRRYLLAALTEEERERVEARLMVEDELVDEYLDQVLTPRERQRFEETFLGAPERQHKLRFAKALRAYAAKAARVGALEVKRERAPWWQPILTLLNPPRPILAYSLGTAVLILAIGGPWTLVRMAGLEHRIEALQSQQQSREAQVSSLHSQYVEQRAKTDRIAAQLRQEQEKWSAMESAAGKGTRESRFPLVNTLAMVLTPGMTRGANASQRLEIPKGVSLVTLKLDLPENRFKTYKAVLLNDGQEILSRSGLKASDSGSQIIVRLDVPASDLQSGDYAIQLFGAGQNDFDSYVLRVIKK
jgi:uncharacterized coiled-coil protein SlyX